MGFKLNNQAIYPLAGNAINTVTGIAATNTGVTFAPTLSDYFAEIETESGIDLNTYQAGEVLPANFTHSIVADKSTNAIKLKNHNRERKI